MAGLSSSYGGGARCAKASALVQRPESVSAKSSGKHNEVLVLGRGEARQTYFRMVQQGLKPALALVISALKECGFSKDLDSARRIHRHTVESGQIEHAFVATRLVDAYAKCGRLLDSGAVFESIRDKNAVAWNCIIMGHAENGEGDEALRLFFRMRTEGRCAPNRVTFLAALKACMILAEGEAGTKVGDIMLKQKSLEKGRLVHSHAGMTGNDRDMFVVSRLIDMFVKCGSMVDARIIFETMPRRDIVVWNTIILGYADCGNGSEALKLFGRMQEEEGIRGQQTPATYLAAAKACISLAEEQGAEISLREAKAIHLLARKTGNDSHVRVASRLVDMYAKCGSLVDARAVFDNIGPQQRNQVVWTVIISGYAENGEGEAALQLYQSMQDQGVAPNHITYMAALKACKLVANEEQEAVVVDGELVKPQSLKRGRAIHSQALSSNKMHIFVANSLVDMYAACGSLRSARAVFEAMAERSVVSWTSMILAYAHTGEGETALQLFSRMQEEDKADAVVYVAALKACAVMAENQVGQGTPKLSTCLERGKAIHSQASMAFPELEITLLNNLVAMYAKCGSITHARQVFEGMKHTDLVSWNSLLLGYTDAGQGETAWELYNQMREEEKATDADALTYVAALKACGSLVATLPKVEVLNRCKDVHAQATRAGHESRNMVANSLIDAYSKCGSVDLAWRVLEEMPVPCAVSWSGIIMGSARSGRPQLALQCYRQMQYEGCRPDAVTFAAAIEACSLQPDLEFGRRIENHIRLSGIHMDVVLANSLIDFYGKCGSMVEAQNIFDSMHTRDLVTWNSLIDGYSRQGDSSQVFHLFEEMYRQHFQPNDATFVSIITVCSHAGLVDKGKEYFEAMSLQYGVLPNVKHYSCMVDLLGRANRLDEALAFINSLPFEPNTLIWMTFLSACHKWKDVGLGRLAFENVVRLGADPAAYVMMSNIYAQTTISAT